MPPKQQVSKKTENKQKEKVIEDKTFGLKNKKGAKQQKFIQQVQNQVKNQSAQKVRNDEQEKKKEKDRKQKELEDLNALFKSVEQAVPKGVDPKSIVCENFKKAKCTKGDKCKFSHDLNVGRKTQKINIYEDKRDLEDGMNDPKALLNRSQKICKHFIEAVETKKYGWFWVCPNGGNNCQYRHAMPEDYVPKSEKKEEKPEEQISLEDLIEKERAMITDTTKITLETFLIWKKKKLKEKEEQRQADTAKKQADFNKDKITGLSGREMFTFNKNLSSSFNNQEDIGDDEVVDYQREDDEDETVTKNVREINLDEFSMMIIRENEEELARQKAQGDSQASSSSGTSKPNGSLTNGVADQQPSTSKINQEEQPSSSNMNTNHDEPGPSNSGLINAGDLEIDEELFSAEMNQLSDLELSDEEDVDDGEGDT